MGLNKWDEVLKPGSQIAIGARFKHDSPDIANRRVKVYYEFFYYRLGGYNWYENPYTTGKATVNGVVKYHNTSQLVNLYHQTRHTVHSGNMWVEYGSSTTKSMPYKFEHDGSRVPPIDASIILSGKYELPTIGSSTPAPTPTPTTYATLSSVPTTFRVGQTYTVSVNSKSSSYMHMLSLTIDGEYNAVSSKSTATKITFTVPESSRFGTKEYLRGFFMLHTFNSQGTYLGGDSYTRNVYPKPKPPTSSGISIGDTSGTASGVFTRNDQVLMGLANITVIVNGATAVAPGASINQYEVTLKNDSGTTRMTATSSKSTVNLGVPNYSLSGNESLDAYIRVRDTNGTWSKVNKSVSVLRIHRYSSPSGNGSVTRNGASANIKYNWNISSLKEGGSTEKNSVTVTVQSKPTNSTSWSSKNTYDSTSLSGNNSLNLSGYDTVQGYDFRILIKDGVAHTYVNIGSIGTEAVPLDLSKGGAGVGKIHSGSGANLQVGSGGINTDGPLISNDMASVIKNGVYNQLGMGAYYGASSTNTGAITLTMPSNHNGMFSATINIWSYSYSAVLEVSGYTYTGNTQWHQPHMIGNIDGGDINVRFRSDGAKARYITIGETTTAWGGYLQVTVENVKSGYGGSFPGPIGVSLVTSLPGNTNTSTIPLRKLFNTYLDGSGSGLDADYLDGKHASTIISEAIAGVKIPPSGAATTGVVSGRGRWFQTGDLLICTQVAFISGFFSSYSLTGSWTYPKAFSEAPFVQVAGGHDGMSDNTYRMTGELSAYNVTSTGTSVHFAGGPFASGNSKRVYMLAIGRV